MLCGGKFALLLNLFGNRVDEVAYGLKRSSQRVSRCASIEPWRLRAGQVIANGPVFLPAVSVREGGR